MTHSFRGGSSIVSLAVMSEAALLILAYLISWGTSSHFEWGASVVAFGSGIACALPLLGANHLLFIWTRAHPETVYARFSRQVVLPLCRAVTVRQAAVIAILSGICEEALFRGALNVAIASYAGSLCAMLITSVTFAYVHFIGHMRAFGGMIPLYSLVGAILWLIWYGTNSLAAVATAHAAYNFLAIVSMKYLERPNGRTSDAPRE